MLVWLGRRRSGGIEPGCISRRPAGSPRRRPTVFNPAYELCRGGPMTSPRHAAEAETVEVIIRHRPPRPLGGWRGSSRRRCRRSRSSSSDEITHEVRPRDRRGRRRGRPSPRPACAAPERAVRLLRWSPPRSPRSFPPQRPGRGRLPSGDRHQCGVCLAPPVRPSPAGRWSASSWERGPGGEDRSLRWRRDRSMVAVCGRLTPS